MDKKLFVPSISIAVASLVSAVAAGVLGFFTFGIVGAIQVFGFTLVLVYAAGIDLRCKLVSDWVHLIVFLLGLITFIPNIINGNTVAWVFSIIGFFVLPLPFLFAAVAGRAKVCPECKTKLSDGSTYCGDCGEQLSEDGTCVNCGKGKDKEYFCKNCGLEISTPVGGGDIKLAATCGFLLGFRLGFVGMIIGLILAIAIQGVRVLVNKASKKVSFALVPYLAIGFVIAYFWDVILEIF